MYPGSLYAKIERFGAGCDFDFAVDITEKEKRKKVDDVRPRNHAHKS